MFFMISLSLMCSDTLVPQTAWSLDTARREAFIASLPRGETFENDGSTYAWLPTLRAEKTDKWNAASHLNTTDGLDPRDSAADAVVERKGLFSVYRQSLVSEASIHTAGGLSGDIQTYPVVLNLKTYSLGIITGNLWLKLKDMADAQPIADAYGLSLSFVNIPMATAFYSFPPDMNIPVLQKQLEADKRILLVTLDMVDRISRLR